ncbi:ABC transporter substrate-binding protein [Pararhodobacter marinus]|uniref:Putrescine-binding periplasmic protein n=1 Tax=Pararhodobacter marinus TaxID=2184063 RepID=A0A2U2CB93_9RHOB|nr:extracellular solute-binding protein [Pararhodobacter marinus]PWE29168.1 putrescine/spermidine ABC transporter substrate-binding protein [Pararhodobacter marinus]|eukprot:m.11111 g.11111  ORF g.11111 m.11111 type:complete len:343 (+) comp6381_c0_seq1:172-1200(+)
MKKTLVSTLALLASAGLAHADGVLNIYNWGNYTSPELIEQFTADTGIEVTITDFDSNETALARIRQGGHGFDIVVPTHSYVPIWIEEGLLQPLDPEIVTDRGNIAPQWVDVDFDPGREYTVPWQWGTTGIAVNTSVYDGDINTADIIFNPPESLVGRINVIPEMSDVMAIAIYAAGGDDVCTDDMDVLRATRDMLMEAKPNWLSLDYGTIDNYVAGDILAGIYWNGATMRARLQNPDVAYGYPATGYPVWMDNAAVLADAQNTENAMIFINYILQPEHAAMLSDFARYGNGIAGSEEFMDPEMASAPEISIPEELVSAGRFNPTCPQEIQDIRTQIWTELLQ